MILRAIFAVSLALTPVAALAASGAALTPPVPTVTPTYFGMHTETPQTWPALPFGSLGKGNCVQWIYIQPNSTPSYNWSALDKYATAAQTHGVTFTYAPGTFGIPDWATSDVSTCQAASCGGSTRQCGAPPTTAHEADLKAFFAALAARYCTQMSYELWNEPWNTGNMTGAQLAVVTADEEAAIRSTCPNAVILSPSFSGANATDTAYMTSYYNAGAPTDVNAVSLHIYTNGGPGPVDYPESINPNTGHQVDFGNALTVINQFLPGKPIWMTEGSYGCGSCSADFTTAATQAGFVARWYLIQWSMGFQRNHWYEYDNAGFGTLNPATRSDGSSVPQTAYTQTYNWLVGRQMTAPCSTPTPTATAAVYTCGIAGAGNYQALAAWITNGSTSFTPPNPSSYTQWRDLAGAVHAYAGGAVTITTSPILFEN